MPPEITEELQQLEPSGPPMSDVTVAPMRDNPLRGDGQRYAAMLQRAGVSVDYICYPGMIHDFVQMTAAVSEARRLHRHLAEWIRSAVDETS